MSEVAQVISAVGFPIAAFLLMFWFCKDQLNSMEQTINKNTEVITKLTVYMERVERGDDK